MSFMCVFGSTKSLAAPSHRLDRVVRTYHITALENRALPHSITTCTSTALPWIFVPSSFHEHAIQRSCTHAKDFEVANLLVRVHRSRAVVQGSVFPNLIVTRSVRISPYLAVFTGLTSKSSRDRSLSETFFTRR